MEKQVELLVEIQSGVAQEEVGLCTGVTQPVAWSIFIDLRDNYESAKLKRQDIGEFQQNITLSCRDPSHPGT